VYLDTQKCIGIHKHVFKYTKVYLEYIKAVHTDFGEKLEETLNHLGTEIILGRHIWDSSRTELTKFHY